MAREQKKHILFCILNWGLGHASRSIPIIKFLIGEGYQVTLASDGVAAELLRKTFPHLELIPLSTYRIVYGKHLLWNIFKQVPKIFKAIRAEKKHLQIWLAQNRCDLIISDNRYGAFDRTIPSILITHQLNYPGNKLSQWLSQLMYALFCKPFNEIWIPDHQPPLALSGILSLNYFIRRKYYIGPWSAMTVPTHSENLKYDLVLVLSGPEPNRTWLQNAYLELMRRHTLKAALITGVTAPPPMSSDRLSVFGLLTAEDIARVVSQSRVVLSRSGYSSIMDWALWGKPVILIPTPGQPEQEYLARFLNEHYNVPMVMETELEHCLTYVQHLTDNPWPRVHQDFAQIQAQLAHYLNADFYK